MSSFDDIAAQIADWLGRHSRPNGRPTLLGLAGAQGSGKSFLARRIASRAELRVADFSLDDVYLPRAARAALATTAHPLFATRGPPGTHDLALYDETIGALIGAGAGARTALPRFDKLADDVAPRAGWPVFEGRPDAILVDGWCVGARPASAAELAAPVNALERDEDRNGDWRGAINDALSGPYAERFEVMDAVVYLAAPGFEAARAWRLAAERAAFSEEGRAQPPDLEAQITRFTAHFERITRAMLDGARRAELIVHLDADRRVLRVEGALPGDAR